MSLLDVLGLAIGLACLGIGALFSLIFFRFLQMMKTSEESKSMNRGFGAALGLLLVGLVLTGFLAVRAVQ